MFGQLGDDTTTSRLRPVQPTGLTDVTSIATGNRDTCAVLRDRTARCWGSDDSGELGDGGTAGQNRPTAVRGLSDATSIVPGVSRTCALLAGRTVTCWGDTGGSPLSGSNAPHPRLAPTPIAGLSDVAAISGFGEHVCALSGTDSIQCWGSNDVGQLGDSTTSDRIGPVPVVGLHAAT